MGLSFTLSFELESHSERKTGNYVFVVSLIHCIKQFPANYSNNLMVLYCQKSSYLCAFFAGGWKGGRNYLL